MDNPQLRTALCRMTRKRPEEILPHLSLGSLGVNSSFGLSALRSLLERERGMRLPPLLVSMTVEEVDALLKGQPVVRQVPANPTSTRASPPPASTVPVPGNLWLGMDMQEIAVLPEATDFRAHDFYTSHFSAGEIATAMLRPDPRAHLAGIFCAKEAAKKSHPALLLLRMDELEVIHDQAGKPMLRLLVTPAAGEGFRFLLSITHTTSMAAATCITIGSEN